jgi:UrcA family protein
MKTFAIALATLLTGCLAATAQATVPVKSVQQQVVRYGDLNLASQADASILLGRIKECRCRSRSRPACAPVPTTRPHVPSPTSTRPRRCSAGAKSWF